MRGFVIEIGGWGRRAVVRFGMTDRKLGRGIIPNLRYLRVTYIDGEKSRLIRLQLRFSKLRIMNKPILINPDEHLHS